MRDDRRGQSEPLGFLLIFGVVVLTIALVGVTGFAGLESVQDFQRTTNAEQGFVALADDVEDVTVAGAPGRTTEVRIAGGSLSLTTAETTITVDYANGTTSTTTVETHPLVYDSGTGTTITYRSGAVIRRDGESAVLVRDPRFVVSGDRTVLSVINATQVHGGKVGGTTAVGIRTRAAGTRLLAADAPVDGVTLNVSSPNAAAWARYFERFEGGGPVTSVSRSGDSVEVTIDTDRLYVTVHRLTVEFE